MNRWTPTNPPSLLRVLLGLGLDYVRWTQLVPMVMSWVFLLLMVGAMLVVNFQQQSFGLIDWGIGFYERIAGPLPDETDEDRPAPSRQERPGRPSADGTAPATGTGAQGSGSVRFTEAELEPLVLKLWGLLALTGWLLGMAWRLLFGAPPRRSLKFKLALAGAVSAACTALFLVAYLFGSEEFNGPFAQWLALFVVVPLVVWCVSAYGLAVSALVDRLKRWLYRGPTGDAAGASAPR